MSAILVRVYALLLLAFGGLLLFVPELLVVTDPTQETAVITQILAAALLGFGAANWTARNSILGGIYGRSVVAGNQAFAAVAALVLLRGMPADPSSAFWGLAAVLVLGAVLFTILTFRPSWIQAYPPPSKQPG